ncbi:MAG TPA: adenosylcobalamin-dependent ribonucleoside-diphosphate reductase [Candidatus Nanoarchaeia archaeon]|nr:adenosylcobalamin-dependent ribonucleoside-diphosphate reductase [Candidatus Nanoarchaeia archaeon]
MAKLQVSKNAQVLLEEFYLKRNDKGEITETPEQLLRRVAHALSRADGKYHHKSHTAKLTEKYTHFWEIAGTKEFQDHITHDPHIKETEEEFYELLTSFDFLPSSTILFNAGKSFPQLAGSAAIELNDSVKSIFHALQVSAAYHQSGAGTALNFSNLRPKGDMLKSGGTSSGSLSYMKIFNIEADVLKKGGKKRGSHAALMRYDHPDIKEFITTAQQGQLRNFTAFVGINDKFLQAAEKNASYNLINPRTNRATGKQNAHELLALISDSLLKAGTPSIVFLDKMDHKNPLTTSFNAVSIAGESFLHANSACMSGSINMSHMIKDKAVDYERLKKRVIQAVHFLDNAIDMSASPTEEIAESLAANRTIGLGVMGFADMLAQLAIKYNSDKALKMAEEVMSFINQQAADASTALASHRGAFPNSRKSRKKLKIRNAARTAIAPANMISIIAQCSAGIEPYYGMVSTLEYGNKKLIDVNPHFVRALKEESIFSSELLDKVKNQGNLKGLFIPVWIKNLFITTDQIPTEWHVKMLAAFQKHCDSGVAKQIVFSADATSQHVDEAIKSAYAHDCVSFIGYRYGGRAERTQVLGMKHGADTNMLCPSCNIPLERDGDTDVCKNCGYGIIE